jgi:hypothetical protein
MHPHSTDNFGISNGPFRYDKNEADKRLPLDTRGQDADARCSSTNASEVLSFTSILARLPDVRFSPIATEQLTIRAHAQRGVIRRAILARDRRPKLTA